MNPKMLRSVCSASFLSLLVATGFGQDEAPSHRQEKVPFTPDWASLHHYTVPEWYRDAKFGIFLHWGVFSVPETSCWYAREMYLQGGTGDGDRVYRYHLEHYGHPSKFGFKDLIPLWKAEKWDPDELVALFKRIGARYVVSVAVHHDNFDNFASTYQPWNSVNMGPHRDIIGDWRKAILKQGLRFGVSSHNDRAWQWLNPSHGSDSSGPLKGVPYDGDLTLADGKGKWWEGYDPRDLYCVPHAGDPMLPDSSYMQLGEPPDAAFRLRWFRRTKELVEKYQPDLLWFDGPMPLQNNYGPKQPGTEDYGLQIASLFYNQNQAAHEGRLEAVLNIKSWGAGTVPDESAVVLDIEKGLVDGIRPNPWQTDTSILPDWVYTPGPATLSDEVIVHNLCDIVSKNGNLLLNVSLKADGTLPQDQREILEHVGDWLSVNGEAIFGTRPWKVFGEGPTRIQAGDFKENTHPFTAQDIRFTSKGDTLYAIFMGWPADGTVRIGSVPRARSVELIGCKDAITWDSDSGGLVVHVPTRAVGRFAYVLRIKQT
jgi:alpha-L-fucosidase